jgi:two-component system OmpR family response regulator
MNKELILVVDDDPQITSFLKRYLEKQEYRVVCASDGREMQSRLASESVDLCILDIGLPGKNGLDITRDLRTTSNLPILVLSGRDETYDRVVGLEFGADDYMVKPFEPRELLARIRTILRRSKAVRQQQDNIPSPSYQFDKWVFNYDARTLINDDTGDPLTMTTTEFEILNVFITNPNTIFSRNQLLDAARGRESFSGDRAIDVHIMRIRKKLFPDDPSGQVAIKTIHGMGYSFTISVLKLDS